MVGNDTPEQPKVRGFASKVFDVSRNQDGGVGADLSVWFASGYFDFPRSFQSSDLISQLRVQILVDFAHTQRRRSIGECTKENCLTHESVDSYALRFLRNPRKWNTLVARENCDVRVGCRR